MLQRLRAYFDAATATMDEVADCIRRVKARSGYLLDPHTACGVIAAERPKTIAATPHVVLATASPAKFPDAIEAIAGERPALPPRLASLMTDPERMTVLPNDLAAVQRFVAQRADGPQRSRRMTIDKTRLPNGLRVVSIRMPHLETVSMGIWVGVGARHETAREQGISHLLEHMAFKGTERRTARDIAEEIEAVGGELNAATSLETTAYYSRVLAGDIGLALDILADILQSPRYSEEELEREREVILQEIAATRDSPDEIAYELLQEVAFPDQAIGRPILGTVASVKASRPPTCAVSSRATTRANRMVLSAAGKIDHGELVRHAEALFGGMNGGEGGRFEPARYGGGTRTSAKPFEQSHLLLAFEGPSYARANTTRPRCSRRCSAGACRRGCSRRSESGAGFAIRSTRAIGLSPIRACSHSCRHRAGHDVQPY